MGHMFDTLVVRVLNHLLGKESWARKRLFQHDGSLALIRAGSVEILLQVGPDGYFSASGGGEPDVCIVLPQNAPWRLLNDRGSLFQAAKLSGSADFAETLAFVFRNLSWDVEDDLARFVGDIPARRLEMLRVGVFNRFSEASRRFFGNLAEYACEDGALISPRRDIAALSGQVKRLAEDVERLEKRLERL